MTVYELRKILASIINQNKEVKIMATGENVVESKHCITGFSQNSSEVLINCSKDLSI